MLPKEAIQEYKIIYKKEFGIELTDEEASFRANNLLKLYAAVYEQPSFGSVQEAEKHGDNLSK